MKTQMVDTIKHQTKTYGPKQFTENGTTYRITATVRHDDACGNGHNSFAITADINRRQGNRWVEDMCGCCHDEVAEHFPKLAPFIKWHLCSTDGPVHYLDNTIYHAKSIPKEQGQWYFYLETKLIKIVDETERATMEAKYPGTCTFKPYHNIMAKDTNLEAARHTAIWPDATLDQLQDRAALEARLPALLANFRTAVESLGLTF